MEGKIVQVEAHSVEVSVFTTIVVVVDPGHLQFSVAQLLILNLYPSVAQPEGLAGGVAQSDQILIRG